MCHQGEIRRGSNIMCSSSCRPRCCRFSRSLQVEAVFRLLMLELGHIITVASWCLYGGVGSRPAPGDPTRADRASAYCYWPLWPPLLSHSHLTASPAASILVLMQLLPQTCGALTCVASARHNPHTHTQPAACIRSSSHFLWQSCGAWPALITSFTFLPSIIIY